MRLSLRWDWGIESGVSDMWLLWEKIDLSWVLTHFSPARSSFPYRNIPFGICVTSRPYLVNFCVNNFLNLTFLSQSLDRNFSVNKKYNQKERRQKVTEYLKILNLFDSFPWLEPPYTDVFKHKLSVIDFSYTQCKFCNIKKIGKYEREYGRKRWSRLSVIPCHIPPAECHLLQASPKAGIVNLSKFTYSSICVVVTYCSFNVPFLNYLLY